MDAIKEIFRKRKKTLALAAVTVIWIAGLLWGNFSYVVPCAKEDYSIPSNAQEYDLIPLKLDDDLVQTQRFLCETDKLTGICLKLATYAQKESAEILVQISDADTGEVLLSDRVSGEWEDNKNSKLFFSKPLIGYEGQELELSLSQTRDFEQRPLSAYGYQFPDSEEMCFYLQQITGETNILLIVLYWGAGLVLLVGIDVSLWMLIKRRPLYRVFALAAVVVGCVFTFTTLPFGDEDGEAHFYTAYAFSNRLLGIEDDGTVEIVTRYRDNRVNGYLTPGNYSDYYTMYRGLFVEPYYHAQENAQLEKTTTLRLTSAHLYNYIPQTIAITAGRILHLSFEWLIVLARLANLAVYVVIGTLALKKMPWGRLPLFCVLMLPTSMQLGSSLGYDSLFIACAAFFIAVILQVREQETVISRGQIMILFVAALYLMLMKNGAYMLTGGALLLLPRKKFKSNKQYVALIIGFVLSFAVLFLLTSSLFAKSETSASVTEKYSYFWALKNPVSFLYLVKNTFLGRVVDWVRTLVHIPVFLNLENSFSDLFSLLLFANLGMAICLSGQKHKTICSWERVLCLALAAGTVGLIIVGALGWTTVGYMNPYGSILGELFGGDGYLQQIWGIRGRYFIVPIIVFLVPVFSGSIVIKKDQLPVRYKSSVMLSIIGAAWAMITLFIDVLCIVEK